MALQGTLDTFALPDVLRLLAATAKTGRLQISGERGAGEVWLAKGAVVGGVVDARTPTTSDVVFELLRQDTGSFEFVASADSPEGHKPQDVEDVITEAETKLAGWRVVEAVVPSLDHWVALVDEISGDEIVISRGRWGTLIAIGEGRSVANLDSKLDLGEIEVSKLVKNLADEGVVTISEPRAATTDWASSGAFGIAIPAAHDTQSSSAGTADNAADEAVRAELEPHPTLDGDAAEGGSRDVDIDTALDAGLGDHAYLTDGDTSTMPEPLPAGANPQTPAAEAADVDLTVEVEDPAVAASVTEDGAEADVDAAVAADAEPAVEALADAALEAEPAVEVSVEASEVDSGEKLATTAEADFADETRAEEPDIESWITPPAATDADDSTVGEAGDPGSQLTQLSPKAARAIAAAAASPEDVPEGKGRKGKGGVKPEEPMNRNLLMKFISSK